MNIRNKIKRLALAFLMLAPGIASAAVILPALDIIDLGSDAGATVTASSFTIDATAFAIVFDNSNLNIDIADEVVTFTSSSGSYDFGTEYGSFAGVFSVGGLLSGTFSSLEVFGYGNNIDYDFESNLTFISGSLMNGFNSGRIEGIISGDIIQAKLGEVAVVPVPASVWLFGSGLLGLVGVARRKTH